MSEDIQNLKKAIRQAIQPKVSVCAGCRLRSSCSPKWKDHPSFCCNALQNLENVFELVKE